MKKILITGAGQLAKAWLNSVESNYYQNGIVSRKKRNDLICESFEIDLTNISNAKKLIYQFNPDIILNTAAITNVEFCEKNPELAQKVNTIMPGILSGIAAEKNILFIHLSTDHFNSNQNNSRNEYVEPIYTNIYGKTKIEGEHEIIRNSHNYFIIRTNFFGNDISDKNSFTGELLTNLRKHKIYMGATDYYFNPVIISRLISYIHQLIQINFTGLINISSDECISKFEFAQNICTLFDLDRSLIKKIKLEAVPNLANRPSNLCLENLKLKKILKIKSISLEEQLQLLKLELH